MLRLAAVGAGIAVGVIGVSRVRRVARSYTPAGMHARATSWGASARAFAAVVAEGMAEREAELREALGVDVDPRSAAAPERTPADARELLEHPTRPRG